MATVEAAPTTGRVLLENISWETYAALSDEAGDSAVRMTYDRGQLEIEVSPLLPHEKSDRFLERLVYKLCELMDRAVESGGAVTHRREDLARALEPDACYWIEHEEQMRGKMELDLTIDPPPDLVIEVDILASSIDRIDIYRELCVPEVWWLTNEQLRFLVLDSDQNFQTSAASRSFPFLKCADVAAALKSIETIGETEALRRLLKPLK